MLDRAGFPDLAVSALGDAVELGEGLDNRRALAEDIINLGSARMHLGRTDEAERCYRRALAFCEADGEWDIAASARTNLAIIVGNAGQMDEAIELLKRAVDDLDKRKVNPSDEVITRMALLQALAATDSEPLLAIETAKPLLGRLRGELRPDQRQNTIGPLRQCIESYAAASEPPVDAAAIKRAHFPGFPL